ncbi:DJ-1/PfpI family protein [Coprinopsis sp. MPI-PUGE-AT-0042]|nr:DJ-1/PfpI family protein [Coprinopsis sp. MPI-PUGE-AT-0042]
MSSIVERPPGAPPADSVPLNFGLVVYPGFQALDVFGPIDALNVLSMHYPTKLHIVAETLDPVSTKSPQNHECPGSAFSESIVPTHTFTDAPEVVGGTVRPVDMSSAINYIRQVYPRLQYLITVCTGSWLAARAGVLDGKRATTNKASFKTIAGLCPQVNWVGHARWVVDGNIWTSSGVSAGLDVTFAFLEKVYGDGVAMSVANWLEYERHTDPSWDPFANLYGIPPDSPASKCSEEPT